MKYWTENYIENHQTMFTTVRRGHYRLMCAQIHQFGNIENTFSNRAPTQAMTREARYSTTKTLVE